MGYTNNKRKTLALLTAVATLAGGLTAGTAYAGGGGGNRPGTGGSGAATQFWQYKDDASGSWGLATDINSVSRAMANAGVRMDDSSGKAAAALADANSRCVAGFHQRHPGEGDGDCRVVAVGAVSGNGSTTSVWNGSGIADVSIWLDNWNKYIAPGDYNYAGTRHYKTSTAFDDDPSTSVDKLMDRYVSSTASIVIIALDKYQPAPPNYDLTVTTTHKQRTNLKVGSTDPIGDTLHASNNGSSIKENLNGTAIIHYEGQKNGYVAAKTVSKPITFANSGDTQLDRLATPADFGMSHWQEGQYWIDIQVAKQGRMNAAVDTTDKDPAETWNVSAEPPTPPTKTIDEGVSADSMTNRTVITYGTGKGGYEMTFKDKITANGVDYTVDDYKLVDKTDNDRDVSNEFTITWDRKTDTVSAVRTADKGEMPLDHQYEFSFNVTVSKPKDFRKVKDHATGKWNQEPEPDGTPNGTKPAKAPLAAPEIPPSTGASGLKGLTRNLGEPAPTKAPGFSAKTPYSADFAYPASALLRIVSSIRALGVTPRKSAVVTRSLTDHPTLPHIFMDIALLVMPKASPSAFCVFPLSPR